MKDREWNLLWKALSDPTRRDILDRLADGPMTTGQLAEAFPHMTRYAVMKHLGLLHEANLVAIRREGRQRWNHLNPVPLRAIYERWLIRFTEPVAANLLALKRFAESDEKDKEAPE